MSSKFQEYKNFDLSQINKDVLKIWKEIDAFGKSLSTRMGQPEFIFYEGPPSANGMPGIHHVIARTIKDIFCRYKTLKGFYVARKAGWDTHGLPVELGVEKALGITKEDIGKKISVEEYNKKCREDVMRYTDKWEQLTEMMGYWVDMEKPYITYESEYVETLWHLLSQLYKKGLLYKGLSIQPYSPAAGTGLSSHELNLPGCYQDVTDTTAIAQFKVIRNATSEFLFKNTNTEVFMLAWTTTPWTLLSNTGLAFGRDIDYVRILTFNPYTGIPVTVVMAKALLPTLFDEDSKDLSFDAYKKGDKKIPYKILDECKGSAVEGIRYEQLLPYQQPVEGDPFRCVLGDFVSTEDGTGIVHIAPSFGADDFRVGKQYGLGSLTLVDKQGKFVEGCGQFSGRFVKNAYDESIPEGTDSVDVEIAVKLKTENRAFKIAKYPHSYPHCWRTGKPVLYYPLDSWFIRTTALRQRMIELNNTINWKPESTGTGRFGKWLENLVDWNLSRSRYWGTPLPVWVTEDRTEEKCIGSVAELKEEIEKSVKAGFMKSNPYQEFIPGDFSKQNYRKIDLHKPFVDEIILVSSTGMKMVREPDLIDVWFDSGAMPYAQLHYPFENKDIFEKVYPADFIAEGVDQTRGWFFTLHALAVMLFDSVAFKNVVSTGLILDVHGDKMSKSKGNVVEPFKAIEENGSDPLRWYMMTNSQPWDNLKFDIDGVEEVRRKFFGTLYNTYSFFSLYANIDGFTYKEPEIPVAKRQEIDRWIISLLNTLVKEVGAAYENYEPTLAGRAIQDFVIDNLSNWYVRLNRRRYWGGEFDENKIAAYQTLYQCLITVAKLASPISPFFTDQLFMDLNRVTGIEKVESVHLSTFPEYDESLIDKNLEERMASAQKISSMVLGLRKKVNINVRQPLNKILLPVTDESLKIKLDAVKNIILAEVNVKELEYMTDTSGILIKKIKANFKALGPKYGKQMKQISAAIGLMDQKEINSFEKSGSFHIHVDGQQIPLVLDEVEIISEDIPGWLVSNDGNITVALDIHVTEELRQEGIARELINRIQRLRKESDFEVTDKINITIQKHDAINLAIENFRNYIGSQTLAASITLTDDLPKDDISVKAIEIDDETKTWIKITRN
jgi:isoleucyl-tRNA synthetase